MQQLVCRDCGLALSANARGCSQCALNLEAEAKIDRFVLRFILPAVIVLLLLIGGTVVYLVR